jgi:hypothetical protein
LDAGTLASPAKSCRVQIGVLGQCKESIAGHLLHREVVQFFERALRFASDVITEPQPKHDLA